MTKHPMIPLDAPDARVSVQDQASGTAVLLMALGFGSLVAWLGSRRRGWLAGAAAAASSLAALVWVHRNPVRQIAQSAESVLAPCDGVVERITQVEDAPFIRGPAHCIAIRVGIADVQVLRAPLQGTVRYRRYEFAGDGHEDDRLSIGIRSAAGDGRVLLHFYGQRLWRVLPAYLATRIHYQPDLDDAVRLGQVTGYLPLGGRALMLVPASAHLAISPGDRVLAGETVAAIVNVSSE